LVRTPRRDALLATSVVALAAVALVVVGFLVAAWRLYSTVAFLLVSAVGLAVLGVAAYFVWFVPRPQQPLFWFGGAAVAALGGWFYNLRKYLRFGPHGCSKCATRLELLSEQDDDARLSPVRQLEEKIGSVDYDVWICPACLNADTERYVIPFSGFKDCPRCAARTFKEDPQRITRPATTTRAGRARIDGRCVACKHKTVRHVVLPMIPVHHVDSGSSSSVGSSFGSFGGGGGGFGGGSFGGGSSGGGGASRGW
jgi:uncharacterized protein